MLTPAHVSREVNYLYFLVVIFITLTVLLTAIFTRNKKAVRMFVFAMAIWALIEGIGLITGMRTYAPSEDAAVIFVFVAFVEDPGWVCLSYMVAEKIFKKLYLNKK